MGLPFTVSVPFNSTMTSDPDDLKYTIRPANIRRVVDELFDGNTGAFADKIGRPRPNIYGILRKTEGERRGVGEDLARDIERILHLDLYELDRPIDQAVDPSARALLPDERLLIETFRRLSPDNQQVIHTLVRNLARQNHTDPDASDAR